jgi:hypothetical protein
VQFSKESLVSRWKNNPVVDAAILCVVLIVIAASAYLAHDMRVKESFRVAQELSSKRWRAFFKSNPELTVPRKFYDEQELFEHVEEEVARVAAERD